MTVETFVEGPTYTITGQGPYAINWSYADGEEIVARVFDDVSEVDLASTHFTVSPARNAGSGALTLKASTAALYDGWKMQILRATVVEQGWAAGGGPREVGLSVQLDRVIRAIQDSSLRLGKLTGLALRMHWSKGSVSPLSPTAYAGNLLGFDGGGDPFPFPTELTLGQSVLHVDTVQILSTMIVPPSATWVKTQGYHAVGDGGGGLLQRVGSAAS